MAKKTYRLQKRVGSKARIIKPYKIKKTGFEDIGLYARFPWHQTFLDPFVGGWSVALNHPCFDQEVWNTRTIPVIAVNDINSGIIDLAWCLLYIPYNFKMTVKNAIHCQGLWNECRDKALLDRFRSALRFYYSLEANFHKQEFAEGLKNYYKQSIGRGGFDKSGMPFNVNPMKDREGRRSPHFRTGDQLYDIPMGSVEDGIRKFYENEASYGGSARGFWIRQNMNRQLGQQLRGVPTEEMEEGLRHFYQHESSFRKAGTIGQKFGINKNKNRKFGNFEPHIIDRAPGTSMESVEEGLRQWYRTHMAWDKHGDKLIQQITSTRQPVTDLIPDTDEREHEEALRNYYYKTHAFGGKENFQWDVNQNAGSLHHGEPLGSEMEDALRSWYLSQHSYGSRKAFRFSQNVQRNMNVGSERGEIDPSFEEGFQNWYNREISLGDSKGKGEGKNQEKFFFRRNSTRKMIRDKPHDYYDEIHGRLRWMQIFNEGGEGGIYNEDFSRFLKRFIGKMDCGFIYLDPPYFKTIEGKHYEDVLTLEQHQELGDILHKADKEGTKFLLSYDVDERAEKFYSSFKFETIQVPYSVARSYGDGRAQMDEEYLIRNYNIKEDPYMKKVDFTKKTKLDQFMT